MRIVDVGSFCIVRIPMHVYDACKSKRMKVTHLAYASTKCSFRFVKVCLKTDLCLHINHTHTVQHDLKGVLSTAGSPRR